MVRGFIALVRARADFVGMIIRTPRKSDVITASMESQRSNDVVSSENLINNSGSYCVQALVWIIIVREISIYIHASDPKFWLNFSRKPLFSLIVKVTNCISHRCKYDLCFSNQIHVLQNVFYKIVDWIRPNLFIAVQGSWDVNLILRGACWLEINNIYLTASLGFAVHVVVYTKFFRCCG